MLSPYEVKERIPHTWPLFFTRHGHFTPIQQQAIPPILDGHDVLVISATASGKTEAVLAPLIERYWPSLLTPHLSVLYICPTRALVRDLYERLREALVDTQISVAMKTGDVPAPIKPVHILITTPESTDAMLTRAAKQFIHLQAIVLDEIHLFDNTPRGDHLRCLLPRIERIRQYAQPQAKPMQRVALSATVPDPAGVAGRYLHDGVIVQAEGDREIVADIAPLYDLRELVDLLAQRATQKSLIFCNSREEVEQTAVYLRQHLPHHAAIFTHYSNLDSKMRQEVEEQFAATAVAICVSTSTLELGIDIGSVDDVVLIGAPFDLTSFRQRIGRGGRRTDQMRVLCMPKSPAEWARFEALIQLASGQWRVNSGQRTVDSGQFRPSVLVQQIFSLIKQSPMGSIKQGDVRRIAPAEVSDDDIRQILANLSFEQYLQGGRLGEWKPDVLLNELIDRHEIYSNIGGDLLAATAVDAYTGHVIAQTEKMYEKGQVVLFGGKPMVVVWRDRYRFGLAPAPNREVDEVLRFRKGFAAVPFDVTQAVAQSLQITLGQMPFLPTEQGGYLFHFWGTVWGELLTAVLRHQSIPAEAVNEYALYLNYQISQLPEWDDAVVQSAARATAVTLANRLEMGRFHELLPVNVGVTAVIQQLNLPQFQTHYQHTTLYEADPLHEQLHMLLG